MLLGAYCGNVAESPSEEVVTCFTDLLGYAKEHSLEAKLGEAVNKAIQASSIDPIAFIVEILSQPNSGMDIMAG